MAEKPYDHQLKARMQAVLRHPPVHFSGQQAVAVVNGFSETPYLLHACAVLPEHVHLVVAHTKRNIRQVVGHLKSEATKALRDQDWYLDHSPWADHGWNVYLDSQAAMRRAIAYVENNPMREVKSRQSWSCVTPYDETTDRLAQHRV